MNPTRDDGPEEQEPGSLAAEQSETRMRQALERLSGDRSNGERAGYDRPANDRSAQDRPTSDRLGGERPWGERPGGDKPGGERVPLERHPERSQSDRAPLGRPQNGGASSFHPTAQRRHRYVQDGEVPVVQVSNLRERRPQAGPPVSAAPAALPDVGPNAVAHERGARLRAEHALERAQATLHSLETRLGHAEITQREALDLARVREQREQALRAELDQANSLLTGLKLEVEAADLRERELEAALVEARKALREAERTARGWSQDWAGEQPILVGKPKLGRPLRAQPAAPVRKVREAPPALAEEEPEPVKWWLPKPARGRK